MRLYILLSILLSAVILFGCSERGAKKESKEAKTVSERSTYRITFSLSGDDLASQQDLEALNRIKIRLKTEGICEVLGTGSGMGYMTVIFRLHKGESLDSIRNVVREMYPGSAYRIEPIKGMAPEP